MNELLTSPVTPIVATVVAVAGVIAIFIKVASNRRKEQAREAVREELSRKRVRAQDVADQQRRLEEKRSRVIRGLDRTSKVVRRKDGPVRRASIPAPGRPGFRTDAPRNSDPSPGYDAMGMLAAGYLLGDPTPNNCDPTPSSSYDGGSSSSSYDSGSSCDSGSGSSDSGGSFSSDSGGGGDF
jgi:uncharacterized membrane protein YgcG